eukprot:309901-Prymnesium_polylepis.1
MRAQVDHLDDAGSAGAAPANELESSTSMNGPSRYTDLRRWSSRRASRESAQRLDAHARPQSQTVRDATLNQNAMALWAATCKQRLFEEKTDFFSYSPICPGPFYM